MRTRRFLTAAVMTVGMFATARAQEVVTTGPPPALRAHLEAFVKALNSTSDDEWEKMAKSAFAPDYLKKQSPDQRKKLHADLKAQFGTIQVQRLNRNGGPDAPLQVIVKGTVASGNLWIELDDESRFDSIKGEVQKTVHEDRRH
jgi:hypothetical protein